MSDGVPDTKQARSLCEPSFSDSREQDLVGHQMGDDILIVRTSYTVGNEIGCFERKMLLESGGQPILADGLVRDGWGKVLFTLGDQRFPVVDPVFVIGAVIKVLPGIATLRQQRECQPLEGSLMASRQDPSISVAQRNVPGTLVKSVRQTVV